MIRLYDGLPKITFSYHRLGQQKSFIHKTIRCMTWKHFRLEMLLSETLFCSMAHIYEWGVCGNRILSSQKVSLCHEEYFRLIIFKKQKAQVDLLNLLFKCLKFLDRRPVPGTELSQRSRQRMWARCSRGISVERGDQRLSVSHRFCMAEQNSVYLTLVFPSVCDLPPSPLKSQTPTPSP